MYTISRSAVSVDRDRVDAEVLARLARVDPKLLRPIRHRGEAAQMDLMAIRARAGLLAARTSLVNDVRGFSKTSGERLAGCDADQMGVEKASELPKGLQEVLRPLLEQVEALTAAIKECDRKLEQIAKGILLHRLWVTGEVYERLRNSDAHQSRKAA